MTFKVKTFLLFLFFLNYVFFITNRRKTKENGLIDSQHQNLLFLLNYQQNKTKNHEKNEGNNCDFIKEKNVNKIIKENPNGDE